MEIKEFLSNDEAVSPVIGVILMVAITVILAAVIATFVLGLGGKVTNTNPQASFTTSYEAGETADDCGGTTFGNDGSLTIQHSGGDTLKAGNIRIGGPSNSVMFTDCGFGTNSEITAGMQVNVQVDSDDVITISWISQTGESSATLHEWRGPDA